MYLYVRVLAVVKRCVRSSIGLLLSHKLGNYNKTFCLLLWVNLLHCNIAQPVRHGNAVWAFHLGVTAWIWQYSCTRRGGGEGSWEAKGLKEIVLFKDSTGFPAFSGAYQHLKKWVIYCKMDLPATKKSLSRSQDLVKEVLEVFSRFVWVNKC